MANVFHQRRLTLILVQLIFHLFLNLRWRKRVLKYETRLILDISRVMVYEINMRERGNSS